jgi:integrase
MASKLKTIEPIEISLSEDNEITEFLNAQSKNTKATYSTYMKRICEFSKVSGKQLLSEHKQYEHKIFAFQNWLIQKGYSPNYIESCLGCLRGFFSYYRKPLMLTSLERKKIRRRRRTTEDFNYDSETLYKMWLCGSTKMRYVIAMAKSIGLRAEDFSKITYGKLRSLDLNAELPIFLGEIETEKEDVKAYCFLDKDAVESIKALLETNKDKRDSKEVWSARSDDLSQAVKRLADKAKINYGSKRIRFHGFRKFLFDALNRVMSIEKAKMIIGKQTSEEAYLSIETLRESFKEVQSLIAFNGNGVKHKVNELEQQLLEKDALIQQLQTKLAQLQTGHSEMLQSFADLNARLARVEKKTKTHKPMTYRG